MHPDPDEEDAAALDDEATAELLDAADELDVEDAAEDEATADDDVASEDDATEEDAEAMEDAEVAAEEDETDADATDELLLGAEDDVPREAADDEDDIEDDPPLVEEELDVAAEAPWEEPAEAAAVDDETDAEMLDALEEDDAKLPEDVVALEAADAPDDAVAPPPPPVPPSARVLAAQVSPTQAWPATQSSSVEQLNAGPVHAAITPTKPAATAHAVLPVIRTPPLVPFATDLFKRGGSRLRAVPRLGHARASHRWSLRVSPASRGQGRVRTPRCPSRRGPPRPPACGSRDG